MSAAISSPVDATCLLQQPPVFQQNKNRVVVSNEQVIDELTMKIPFGYFINERVCQDFINGICKKVRDILNDSHKKSIWKKSYVPWNAEPKQKPIFDENDFQVYLIKALIAKEDVSKLFERKNYES